MIRLVLLSTIPIIMILITLLNKSINNDDFIEIQKELKEFKQK